MADIKEVNGAFGGVEFEAAGETVNAANLGGVQNYEEKAGNNLPAKPGIWSKFKAFWLQDIKWTEPIKVELTPYQQKVEDDINDFLHQDVTWEKVHDFLFQEVTITK